MCIGNIVLFPAPLTLFQIIPLIKKLVFCLPSSQYLFWFLKEHNYFKSVATKRGFSPSIINQAVKKFTKPPCNYTLSNDVKIKPDNSVVLPFYPLLCFKLAKILKRFNFKVILSQLINLISLLLNPPSQSFINGEYIKSLVNIATYVILAKLNITLKHV